MAPGHLPTPQDLVNTLRVLRPAGGQVAIPNSPVVSVLLLSPSCPSQAAQAEADVAGSSGNGEGAWKELSVQEPGGGWVTTERPRL